MYAMIPDQDMDDEYWKIYHAFRMQKPCEYSWPTVVLENGVNDLNWSMVFFKNKKNISRFKSMFYFVRRLYSNSSFV